MREPPPFDAPIFSYLFDCHGYDAHHTIIRTRKTNLKKEQLVLVGEYKGCLKSKYGERIEAEQRRHRLSGIETDSGSFDAANPGVATADWHQRQQE